MGIPLTDADRNMIITLASLREHNSPGSGYLLGYLRARVDQFLRGAVSREELADDNALVELLYTLCTKLTPGAMREIAAGTRELPGEDVQSGQSSDIAEDVTDHA